MIIKRKRFKIIVFNLLIVMIMSLFMYFNWNRNIKNEDWIYSFSGVALILLVMQLLCFKSLSIKITDFRCLFVMMSYVFLLGRYFVYALGQADNYNLFFYRYSNGELYRTALFSLSFIQAIFCGFLFYSEGTAKELQGQVDKINSDKMLFYIGIILFIIGFPCEVYRNFIIMFTQMATDKYIAENLIGMNGVVTSLGRLAAVAVLFIICSKKLKKNSAEIITFLFIAIEMGMSIFTGARSYTVIAAIVIVICLINMYGIELSLGKIIGFIIIGYLCICFISSISDVRTLSGVTLSLFIKTWVNNIFSGKILYEVLLEFGNTQNTIGMGLKYLDGTDEFRRGKTIVLAWLSAIPGIQRLIPQISLIYNPIDIMKEYMPGYYFGGSLALDMYMNFGKFGIITSIFLGIILSKMMQVNEQTDLKSYGLFYGMYYIFLRMVRCGISEVTRLLIYMFIIYYIIQTVICKLTIKRG